MTAISIKDLTVTYRNGHIGLTDVSLSIDVGELFYVVGASGSGKTTLFRSIAGDTLDISRGDLKVNGFNYRACSRARLMEARRTIGMVFQDFRLIRSMTVDENLEFAMRCIGTARPAIDRRIPEVLELVDLRDRANDLPAELSGGEQQRVAIARAIINNPSLLIADEPTGDLDHMLAREIMGLLRRINSEYGTTTMVITHARDLIEGYSNRIIRLDSGRIINESQRPTVIPFPKAVSV